MQQDILGFEIPMDHRVPVRVVERASYRGGNSQRIIDRELLFAIEARAQRFPFDVRHHVKEQSICFARVKQGEQVGMLQVRGDRDLGLEPFDAKDGAEFREQNLERDVALVFDVAREVDRGHAACADLALDNVAAREGCVQLGDGIHRPNIWRSTRAGWLSLRALAPATSPLGSDAIIEVHLEQTLIRHIPLIGEQLELGQQGFWQAHGNGCGCRTQVRKPHHPSGRPVDVLGRIVRHPERPFVVLRLESRDLLECALWLGHTGIAPYDSCPVRQLRG